MGRDNIQHKGLASIIIVGILVLMTSCEEKVAEPNHSPLISSLTIFPESPTFGDTLTLSASATDEDGDELSYSWSEANNMGQFVSTDEASVEWVANFAVAANAIFQVSVSDGELTATGSNAVTISSADTPEFYYVGSSTCGQCHEEIYEDFTESGHPYKFSFVRMVSPRPTPTLLRLDGRSPSRKGPLYGMTFLGS